MDAGALKIRFGKRLRNLRAKKGLTQARLSDNSGVSLEYISKLERGLASPSFEVMIRVCDALGIDPGALFSEINSEGTGELLLQELSHRVKNDMQFVCSLLDMAAMRAETGNDAEIIKSICRKAAGIARVHCLLSETGRGTVNIAMLSRDILNALCDIYNCLNLRTVVRTDNLHLSRKRALLLGLALNELLVNCFRHGVPGIKEPEVMMTLKENKEEAVMIISDNGPGLPESYESPLPVNGLMLVRNIVETHLAGSFKVDSDQGVTFTIRMPL